MYDPKSKNGFSVNGETLPTSAIHPLLPLESQVQVSRWTGTSSPCNLGGTQQAFWTADERLCVAAVDSGRLVITDLLNGSTCCLDYPENSRIVGGHFAAQEFILQNKDSYFLARTTGLTPFWWRLQSGLLPTVLERAGQTRVYARYYTPTRTKPAAPAEPDFALISIKNDNKGSGEVSVDDTGFWMFWSADGAGGRATESGWTHSSACGHFLIGDIELFGEVSVIGVLERPQLRQTVSGFNSPLKLDLTFDGLRKDATEVFGQVDGKIICANQAAGCWYSLTAVDVNKE